MSEDLLIESDELLDDPLAEDEAVEKETEDEDELEDDPVTPLVDDPEALL